MSSVEEVKLRVAASAAQTREAVVRLQAVADDFDQALNVLRLSAVGAVHPALLDAVSRLEQARQRLDEAHILATGAVDATEHWRAIA
jgi:hypothetical protein